ncbi:3-keto-5-aminohexanoate cleavage protein, partial [bacterium]|nr:3-keto-5-aminohexanoate cleavage protein [bacterium]
MESYRHNPLNPPPALIINLAPTGIVGTSRDSPYIPLDHQRIIEDVAACLELGVQMVHLHARDGSEKHCSDPEPYGRLIEAIRGLPGGREAVVIVTTSGRYDAGFESRSLVLELDGDMKPDMASLTLSSLNFLQGVSINSPDTIRALAGRMLERGIKPELEIFDLGMLNFAKVLQREGLIPDAVYANLLLGNIAGAQAQLLHTGTLLAEIPDEWIVAIAGIGRSQLTANTLALLYADGLRIGLEDNLWFDRERSVLAQNAQLVERVLRLANEMERP